ncbi:hypothetical protein STCU_11859 [Strigomonas culicis]|uniref:Uncharacterized protein n=1 Tax=Strigomonas culicis TaxID=28005 RepID=S9TH53_9TRYP|nr:hypothetical protein STCU_11859 [Strigomonas culicis]|eukprot:EPY15653.1 hypothetical protein STCU_11859 [Strigomonas culicis]
MIEDVQGDEIVEDVGEFLHGSLMAPSQPFVKKGRLPPKKKKKGGDAGAADVHAMDGGSGAAGGAVALPDFNMNGVMLADDMDGTGLKPTLLSPPTRKRSMIRSRSNSLAKNKLNSTNGGVGTDGHMASLKLSRQASRRQSMLNGKKIGDQATNGKPAQTSTLATLQRSPQKDSTDTGNDKNQSIGKGSGATTLAPIGGAGADAAGGATHPTAPADQARKGYARPRTESIMKPIQRPSTFQPKLSLPAAGPATQPGRRLSIANGRGRAAARAA